MELTKKKVKKLAKKQKKQKLTTKLTRQQLRRKELNIKKVLLEMLKKLLMQIT